MPESHSRDRFQNLHEFVTQARTNLNRNNWDYLIGGSETETTLARNRLALDVDRLSAAGIARCVERRLQPDLVRQEAAHPGAVRAGRLASKCSSPAAAPPSPRRHANSATA